MPEYYPVCASPAHGSIGPLRHAVGQSTEVILPLDCGPVTPHMLSWHKPRCFKSLGMQISLFFMIL